RRRRVPRVRRHVPPRGLPARRGRAQQDCGPLSLSLPRGRRPHPPGARAAGAGADQGLSGPRPGERPSTGVVMPTIAIVGARPPGAPAAATVGEEGFDGGVVLIGPEPQPPYDRPPLSKNYLRGMTPFEKTLLRPPDFYRERDIELRLSTKVTSVDPEKRTLGLPGGQRLH